MNDLPRHTLSRIIAKHGRGVCDSPKRVEALLRDLCGGNRREINIIMGALEERVAADLIGAGDTVPRDVLIARLAARLRDNLAYTAEAARWGVEAWAVALGLASEAELQSGAHGAADEASAQAPPPIMRGSKPTRTTPPRDSRQAPPHRGTPNPPQPRPQRSGPPPTTYSPPAPRRSPPPPPKVVLPPAAPPHQRPLPSPQPTPRRGLRLRGCLIVIALLFALIVAAVFAIPAVIVLLQEEQSRPSINEPRIR
jgi:hypothetical protein